MGGKLWPAYSSLYTMTVSHKFVILSTSPSLENSFRMFQLPYVHVQYVNLSDRVKFERVKEKKDKHPDKVMNLIIYRLLIL